MLIHIHTSCCMFFLLWGVGGSLPFKIAVLLLTKSAKNPKQGSWRKKKSSLAFPVSTVVRYENYPWKSHHHPPSHGLGRRLKIYWLDKMRKPHLPESASHPMGFVIPWSGSKNIKKLTQTMNQKKEGGTTMNTPLKINIEHNHGGLVQMTFLSIWVICRLHG